MSSDPERSVQQVSAEGIQQILAELQKLNRRMDTLNTRLFGNPEGRRRRRRAVGSEKGVCSAGILPALFTYIHEFLALLRFLRVALSEDGQGRPGLPCRSGAQTLSYQRERSRRVAALVLVMLPTRSLW